MWIKKANMIKEPETISVQLALSLPLIYCMEEKDATARMKKDELVDMWLESTPKKLDYIV